MKKIFVAVCALFFFAMTAFPIHAGVSHGNPACEFNLIKAAMELAIRDIPDAFDIHTPTANDFQCFEEDSLESMANAVIIVRAGYGAKPILIYFGIFHIHFMNNGKLASATSFFETKWQQLEKGNNWKKPWCEIIKSVYPSELAEQECAK